MFRLKTVVKALSAVEPCDGFSVRKDTFGHRFILISNSYFESFMIYTFLDINSPYDNP